MIGYGQIIFMSVDSIWPVFKQVQVGNKVMWKFQMDRIIGRTLIMYPEIPLRKNTPLTPPITYDRRSTDSLVFANIFTSAYQLRIFVSLQTKSLINMFQNLNSWNSPPGRHAFP